MPSLGVIGTGKRVGKTAVSGWLSRRLQARLAPQGGVLVIAMGRGGPPEPELVPGGEGIGFAELLDASRRGRHAASDSYEDAALAGVTAIGCRRCGGGLAGTPFDETVRAALPLVEASGAALCVVEGSGAALPPVACDATLCVSGASQPADYVAGFLGTYRLLLSDALVLTQCEPPFAGPGQLETLVERVHSVAPALEVVTTVFRPRPVRPVRGRKIAFFTTAPAAALPVLVKALEEDEGAEVVLAAADLADRPSLAEDVRKATREADVFLTELKAAAVDVVAEAADAGGKELVLCDNEPVCVDGDLGALVDRLADAGEGAKGGEVMVDERDLPVVDGDDSAPFSKGLMAQSLMATGLRAGARLRRGGGH